MSRKDITIFLFALAALVCVALLGIAFSPPLPMPPTETFIYSFNNPGVLNETADMQDSSSPYLWVNSGGQLVIEDNTGATMQGEAPEGSEWRVLYAKDNPLDTDQGTHPQNIFRLVTRSAWQNASEQIDFLVVKDNFSESLNRNGSNGLFLMSRYTDHGQTLYYAGVRVDGTAVIKKKYKGIYYTMAQTTAFTGTYQYPNENKNLIPHDEWLSLKSESINNKDGSVTVRLFMKKSDEVNWTFLLEATDTGEYDRTPPISSTGFDGIRTDFMDVRFESYKFEEI